MPAHHQETEDMRFSLDDGGGRYAIRAYREGSITVNEQTIAASVIVTATQLHPWPPRSFAELQSAHFAQIAALAPEIAIIGTGARQRFPAPALLRPLIEAGIGVEVMDSAAACRTYNIVMAEGRPVAAALLMIEPTVAS